MQNLKSFTFCGGGRGKGGGGEGCLPSMWRIDIKMHDIESRFVICSENVCSVGVGVIYSGQTIYGLWQPRG